MSLPHSDLPTPSASVAILHRERFIVFLVATVQFVNILDFMMVMPLGPDFANALGIPVSHLGYIGGSYTASAAVAGCICLFFLDRFDRRKALAVAMVGLMAGTALGGAASGFWSLMGARLLAGFFGGPATALAIAIVSDVVPAERRGNAMGAVLSAFTFASVLGVPLGLELARIGGWRLPFVAVAGLGLVLVFGVLWVMPPMREHLVKGIPKVTWASIQELLQRKAVQAAMIVMALAMLTTFAIVPNIAAYLQYNAQLPRENLGRLYLVGGLVSFVVMRIAGRLVDSFGAVPVSVFAASCLITDLLFGFVFFRLGFPVMVIFVGFMASQSIRMVAMNTLTSKIPAPFERARFQSIQSAVQHIASACGAFMASNLLHETTNKTLSGMPKLGIFAVVTAALVPLVLSYIQRILRQRPVS